MNVKFDRVFRVALLFCLIMAVFGIWASAQTETNRTVAVETNQPAKAAPFAMEKHYLTFGLDRVGPLTERTILGEPLWKYVASLLYIALAFVVSKLLDWISCVFLKKITSKTETQLDDVLLELLHGPIKVVAFVIFLHIGLNLFDWPVRARGYLSKGLVLIVAASLTYLAVKLVNLFLDLWKQRHAHEADRKFNDQLFSMIRRTLNAFVIVVAILVTAQNIGVNITAVITSLSIGGLAIGLAAQDTLGNLFGAIAVFADKPFHVGDHIKLADTEGTVESVGMRSTRVRNSEGHLVAIPNKIVNNAAIANITRRSNIKTTMNVLLPHDLRGDKIKRALAILQEIYRGHNMTQDVWISFNQFAGRNLNVMIVHWWKGTDYQKYLAGMQEMNLAVKERFDAEGIAFA